MGDRGIRGRIRVARCGVDTLLEIGDVYGVNAADIVREVEEARRAARRERVAADIANTPPVE